VLELDATESADHPALQEALAARWGGVDGAVHVIGPGQPEGQGAIDPGEAMRRATAAFRVGAYSLSAVARAVAPLMREPAGLSASIVGVSAGGAQGDRMAGAVQDALEGVNRYAACELGPRGVRVNLVVAGPLTAPAIAGKAACFLLSDWARGISGDVLHVDGGMHLGAR
jgi:enoyl-[acyl-carrier protein] reductase I